MILLKFKTVTVFVTSGQDTFSLEIDFVWFKLFVNMKICQKSRWRSDDLIFHVKSLIQASKRKTNWRA